MVYELPVRLVVSRDLSMPLPMRLQYVAGDPYAVRAALHPLGYGGRIEWFFSRDMLAQALQGHAGHGDVRLWSGQGLGRDVLYIALSPPTDSILLEVPAQGVESFLRETRTVVPPGAESSQLDLDAELAHLLAGS
ncbi:SsgA family sporulation/cell division regulator [Streptomyces sp. 900116325]